MKNAVNGFWSTLANIYGASFTDRMGMTPNSEWVALFSGLDREQVERGYKRMKADKAFADWPPSLLRFEQLCLPTAEDMGLPDTDSAYQMATGNNPHKDKAVAWTLEKMGSAACNVKNSVEKTSRPLFTSAYQKHAIDYVADGNTIPEIESENTFSTREPKTPSLRKAHAKFMDEFRQLNWA